MSRNLLSKCTCFINTSTTFSRQASSTSILLDASSSSSLPSTSAFSNRSSSAVPPRRPRSYGIKPPEGPIRNDSEWRSTSRPAPHIPLQPRIGSAQREYKLLAPEGKRREDLARQKLLESFSIDRLYAMERERERIYNSSLDHKPLEDRKKLVNSVHAILRVPPPQKKEGFEGERGSGFNNSKVVPAARVIGSRLPKDSKGNRIDPRVTPTGGMNKNQGGNVRDIKQTMEKVYRKDGVYMTPGKVNRNTQGKPTPMKGVQPVIRGQYGAGGPKRRIAPRVLKKVVLPSTIRLENLTNLLGVKLRKYITTSYTL